MFKQYQLKNYNFRLIVLVLALSIMGILVIGSAKESSQIKQITGLGLSLVVMVVASLVDYTWLLKLQWLMYAGSIAILAAVIFFGKEVNGSRRWFEIPHIGLTFQPAELVKILMILFFAKFFMDHQEELQQKNRTVLIAVGLAAPLLLLVYKQPDLSTTICMTLIFCTVNLVFVSAAMSSAKATTINSSSQIIAVDMIPYASILCFTIDIFLLGRYVFIILISGSE